MSIFSKNLSAFSARYPAYAGRLRPVPVLEPLPAQLTQEPLMQQGVKCVVMLGSGDGRILRRVYDELLPVCMVIVEPDFERLSTSLHHADFSALIEDPTVFFIAGSPLALDDGIAKAKSALAAYGFQIIIEPDRFPPGSAEVEGIASGLRRVIETESLHLKTRLERAKLVQGNLIRNLPVILESHTPDRVAGRWRRKPAVVIAAGPSLDKNVEALKPLQTNTLLIAVDTAVRTLHEHGIQPHAVVTSDPTPENARHFDGVELADETLFVFSPDVQHSIMQRFRPLKQKLCLHDTSTRFSYYLQEKTGFQTIVERPMNVSETAVRFALLLGCDPVIFAGLDLALLPDGDRTHAESAALSQTILSRSPDRIEIRTKEGDLQNLPLVTVEGYDGTPLPSYPIFKVYLEELERIIAQNPIRWVDATEGGAKKRGCMVMTLERVGQMTARLSFNPAEWVQSLPVLPDEEIAARKRALDGDFGYIQTVISSLNQIAEGNIETGEAERRWLDFLRDKTVRAYFDHAVFRFQLCEPLRRMNDAEKSAAVRQYAMDATETLGRLVAALEESLR